MDDASKRIRDAQDALLTQMNQFRVMRSGTLSQQHYPERARNKGGSGACGPYFVWQGYRDGKHFSQRVPAAQADRVQHEIEQRLQFEALCAKYISLGQRLAERTASDEAEKKGLKPPSRKARRSRA